MATKNVIRGEHVTVIAQLNGNQIAMRFKSFKVDEEIQDGYDHVGGEHRGRPYRVTDGFKATYEVFNEDSAVLDAWLSQIANSDANLAPFSNVVGVVLKFRDGTRKAYKISGNVTLGPVSVGYGSRGEAVMFPSYFRAQNFVAV